MAHPLTQHPPNSIPFPSAPRPSPLAFGFGLPTSPSPLSFGTPSRPSFQSSSSSFGFGYTPTASYAGPSSPKKSVRPGVSPSPGFRSATAPSLKRARRSPSPTPSTSPSPSSSNVASPALGSLELPRKEKDDAFSVGSLALKDDGEGKKVRKEVKRLRRDAEAKEATVRDDVDAGVLLAALPPSAHLPILLEILSANPQLAAGVMANLPRPDHNECLAQLSKHSDAVKRAAGGSNIQLNANRLWSRVEKDVQAFIKMASTYITFFTSQSALDPPSIHHLLQGISTHIIYLLGLIPPSSDTNSGTTQALLQFGKRVISAWTNWLDAVSAEVNQRNGMFPHSTVEAWAYNLDQLAKASQQTGFGWSYPQKTGPPNPLVESFRDAMRPLRDRFVTELGWLIGRRADNFTNPWGNNAQMQNEDEEL